MLRVSTVLVLPLNITLGPLAIACPLQSFRAALGNKINGLYSAVAKSLMHYATLQKVHTLQKVPIIIAKV